MKSLKRNGSYRGIPIHIVSITGTETEFYGTNWFYDILVDLNLWWDCSVLQLEDLPIWVDVDEEDNIQ